MRPFIERILGLDYYRNRFTKLYRKIFWYPRWHTLVRISLQDSIHKYKILFKHRDRLYEQELLRIKKETLKHLKDIYEKKMPSVS